MTNCHQLKKTAEDGKQRFTDVADTEQFLRLVQSVPSKKAEPIKQWLAKVGEQLKKELGESVISPKKAIDIATPTDELPFAKKGK